MKKDQSLVSRLMALIGIVISVLYLANLTFGVVEIPDNLPLIGNLDEVFFSGLLFTCLARFGIHLPFAPKKNSPPDRPN